MRKLRNIFALAVLACAISVAGCFHDDDSSSNGGFKVRTKVIYNADFSLLQGGNVDGQHLADRSGASGSVYSFNVFTPSGTDQGTSVEGARAPARWRFNVNIPATCFPTEERDVDRGSTQTFECFGGFVGEFSASPNSIDVQVPPPTVTISGSDMSGAYGMPSVAYYDEFGYLVAETTATAMASDGSWIQANTPDLSSVYSGSYNVIVRNATADGAWNPAGVATIDVYGNDPPPPPDPQPDPCTCPPLQECLPCEIQNQ